MDTFKRGDAVTYRSRIDGRIVDHGHILAPSQVEQDDDGKDPIGEPYIVYPIQVQGGRGCGGWWPADNLTMTENPTPPAWPID